MSSYEPLSVRFYRHVLAGSSGQLSYNVDEIRRLWIQIVWDFSQCSLIMPLDRFAAVLGLASAIALRTRWQYTAGYWLPLTLEDLLWYKSYENNDTRRTGLSPSWSWLSITGGIVIDGNYPFEPYQALAEVAIGSGDDVAAAAPGVAATTNQLVPGENINAQPPVPSRLSSLVIRLGPPAEGTKPSRPEWWPSVDEFEPKVDLPNSFQGSVFLLPLGLRIRGWKIVGLLVSPSTAYPGTYQRVGYFSSERHSIEDEDIVKMWLIYQMLRDKSLRQRVILV